jgi:peptidoglycan lytic transglycosylase
MFSINRVIGLYRPLRLLAVALAAAALAACAQSSVLSSKSELRGATREVRLDNGRHASEANRSAALRARQDAPPVTSKRPAQTAAASYGLASFYREGGKTASGEKFDPHELTAAHPTLPFGTRLRVTNVATHRSVIVRVNDRGPFVHGRVVDVSYSAAETLGMTGRGVAKVKVDVVQ